MALVLLSNLFFLVSVACYVLVLVHAFKRSVGTGFLVLCLVPYPLMYGFSQFEHPRKGLVLAGWLGCFVVGVVMRMVGLAMGAG